MKIFALKFEYNNHKGEDHVYVVDPEEVARFYYGGAIGRNDSSVSDGEHFVLNALVITRDGKPRHMGRRSFVLTKMRNLEETMEELQT